MFGAAVIILFADCAGGAGKTAVNNIGVYDLSYPDEQQCLLIIPRQITVHTIDGDTVQWNWNNSETRVKIPSGPHMLSVKRDKETVDIMFDFMPDASYTFSTKNGAVTVVAASKAQ
jgi:hypothetical protein